MESNLWYYVGSLWNNVNSNENRGMIGFNVKMIKKIHEDNGLKLFKADEKAFNKILKAMQKFDDGYWIKENTEYKILLYALIGLLTNSNN